MPDDTSAPTPSPARPTAQLGAREVHRIGYGAMQLASIGGRPAPDPQQAVAVLRRAVELGVDHIDTADFYGDGTANALIREALHPYRDELAIVSKVGASHDPGRHLVAAQRPAELRAGVEANLRRLGVERIAAVNMRRLDAGPGIVAEGDQVVSLDDQLAELAALRDEGKIEGIGLSNVSLEQLRQALPVGIVCVQNLYNLLERDDDAVLAECAAHGIAYVPIFPLGSAFPNRPSVLRHPTVLAVADRLGATAAQVGLGWLLARDEHVLLIPGTSGLEHLEQNLAAGQLRLDAATIAELDAVLPAA